MSYLTFVILVVACLPLRPAQGQAADRDVLSQGQESDITIIFSRRYKENDPSIQGTLECQYEKDLLVYRPHVPFYVAHNGTIYVGVYLAPNKTMVLFKQDQVEVEGHYLVFRDDKFHLIRNGSVTYVVYEPDSPNGKTIEKVKENSHPNPKRCQVLHPGTPDQEIMVPTEERNVDVKYEGHRYRSVFLPGMSRFIVYDPKQVTTRDGYLVFKGDKYKIIDKNMNLTFTLYGPPESASTVAMSTEGQHIQETLSTKTTTEGHSDNYTTKSMKKITHTHKTTIQNSQEKATQISSTQRKIPNPEVRTTHEAAIRGQKYTDTTIDRNTVTNRPTHATTTRQSHDHSIPKSSTKSRHTNSDTTQGYNTTYTMNATTRTHTTARQIHGKATSKELTPESTLMPATHGHNTGHTSKNTHTTETEHHGNETNSSKPSTNSRHSNPESATTNEMPGTHGHNTGHTSKNTHTTETEHHGNETKSSKPSTNSRHSNPESATTNEMPGTHGHNTGHTSKNTHTTETEHHGNETKSSKPSTNSRHSNPESATTNEMPGTHEHNTRHTTKHIHTTRSAHTTVHHSNESESSKPSTHSRHSNPESATTNEMPVTHQHNTRHTTEHTHNTRSAHTTVHHGNETESSNPSTHSRHSNPDSATTNEMPVTHQHNTRHTTEHTHTTRSAHTTVHHGNETESSKPSTHSRHSNPESATTNEMPGTHEHNTRHTTKQTHTTRSTPRIVHHDNETGSSKPSTNSRHSNPESATTNEMPVTHEHNTRHTTKHAHTNSSAHTTVHHGNETESSKPSTHSRHSNPESATTNEMPVTHEHNTRHATKHTHTTRSAHTTVHHGNERESSKPSTHSRHSNPESATTNEMPVTHEHNIRHTTEHTHTSRSAHTTVHHGNETESSKPSTHSRHSNPESATTNEMPVTHEHNTRHATKHTHTTRSAHTTVHHGNERESSKPSTHSRHSNPESATTNEMPGTHEHNTRQTMKHTHTTRSAHTTVHHGNETESSKPSTHSRHSNPESATTNEMPVTHEHNTRHATMYTHTTRSAHTTVHHGNETESSKPSTHSRHSNPESATTNEMPGTHEHNTRQTMKHVHTNSSAHTTVHHGNEKETSKPSTQSEHSYPESATTYEMPTTHWHNTHPTMNHIHTTRRAHTTTLHHDEKESSKPSTQKITRNRETSINHGSTIHINKDTLTTNSVSTVEVVSTTVYHNMNKSTSKPSAHAGTTISHESKSEEHSATNTAMSTSTTMNSQASVTEIVMNATVTTELPVSSSTEGSNDTFKMPGCPQPKHEGNSSTLLPAKCGRPRRILKNFVFGTNQIIADIPWMAYLDITKLDGYGDYVYSPCTGVIIAERFILTSGSCLTDLTSEKPLQTYVGSSYKNESQDIHASWFKAFNDYNMGIVSFADPFNFTETVSPICLPKEQYEFPVNTTLQTAGFGGKIPNSKDGVLHVRNATVVSLDECRALGITASNSDYCVRGNTLCRGDCGAPLMYNDGSRYYVVGVAAKNNCQNPGSPVLYSGVFQAVKDILEYMSDFVE